MDNLNEGNLTRPILISITDLRFELEIQNRGLSAAVNSCKKCRTFQFYLHILESGPLDQTKLRCSFPLHGIAK